MRPTWPKIIVALVVLWSVVGGALWWAKAHRPTPERIVQFVEQNSIADKSPAERGKFIETVAAQVNRLEFEQRQEMNHQKRLESFWKGMSKDEKARYLELVLPTGFKQMMENFNKMDPLKRRRLVEKAVKDMRQHSGDGPPTDADPEQIRKIVDEGLKSFYSDATIEAKMDALPFLDELERTVKWSR